jgi:hypothetical protein
MTARSGGEVGDDKISKAVIIDIPFAAIGRELRVEPDVPEEERCIYADHNAVRCGKRRWREDYPHCELHHLWESNLIAAHGAPFPIDRESMHVFLTVVLGAVMKTSVPKDKANVIVRLCELLMKNMKR